MGGFPAGDIGVGRAQALYGVRNGVSLRRVARVFSGVGWVMDVVTVSEAVAWAAGGAKELGKLRVAAW